MVALSTIALVGASVIGAGSAVASLSAQKKAARNQQAALAKQEKDAKTAAREQAGLDRTREDAGAAIKLGQEGASTGSSAGAGTGGATSRDGAVGSRVGGIKHMKPKASKKIGL